MILALLLSLSPKTTRVAACRVLWALDLMECTYLLAALGRVSLGTLAQLREPWPAHQELASIAHAEVAQLQAHIHHDEGPGTRQVAPLCSAKRPYIILVFPENICVMS